MAINRRPLRDDVRQEILRRIIRGRIPAGHPINELELAEELGVSRTPLREALLSLEKEELLVAEPRRGWFVASLTLKDCQEVYPVIAALETLALRLTDPDYFMRIVPELEETNRAMEAAADDASRAQEIDDKWHARLLGGCPNERLLRLIASLKLVVHRYEYAFMSDPGKVVKSVKQHSAIVRDLRRGHIDTAIAHLGDNWRDSLEVLTQWFQENEDTLGTKASTSRRR